MLSVADLVLASGLVSINIQWEEVAADVKEPDFKIELEFVPLPDQNSDETLKLCIFIAIAFYYQQLLRY